MVTAERSISAVLQEIVANVQDIVRAEVRLAKTEVTEEFGRARGASLLFGLGALMAAFSGLLLLLAIVYALSTIMAPWVAALVVAAGVGLVAAVCFGIGIKRFKTIRAAPKTAASLKENVEWAKQLTK